MSSIMTNKLNFTERAIEHINKILSVDKKNKYFRISVKGGGCSGFKYDFKFENSANKDDKIFDKTIIDVDSLKIINGSTVDYKKEMIGDSIVIVNPKAASSCGCGMSFSI